MSDLVLTGHEHVGDAYVKLQVGGDETAFIEAKPLWDPETNQSGFQLLVIELESQRFSYQAYSWADGRYTETGASEWMKLARGLQVSDSGFQNNDEFAAVLDDIGTGFTHSRKKQLTLSDLYVYPDLRRHHLQARIAGKSADKIRSKDVAAYPAKEDRLLVIGADKAGKTSLAHNWYREVQRQSFIPVLIPGDRLRGDERAIIDSICVNVLLPNIRNA